MPASIAARPLLAGQSRPRAAFKSARAPGGRRRVVTVRSEEASRKTVSPVLLRLGSALLSATMLLSAGEATLQPAPASAETALERRQAELQRRKELLAQAREKALAGGGQEAGSDPAVAAATVSAAEAEKVAAANQEVERGNAGRSQEAARLLEGLKGQSYEAATADERKPKLAEEKQAPSLFGGLFGGSSEKPAIPEPPIGAGGGEEPSSPPPPVPPKEEKPDAFVPGFDFLKPKDEASPPAPPQQPAQAQLQPASKPAGPAQSPFGGLFDKAGKPEIPEPPIGAGGGEEPGSNPPSVPPKEAQPDTPVPGFNILKPKPQEDQSTPPQTPKAQLKQAASRPAADSGAGFEFPSFQSLLEPAAKPEPKAEPAPAALEPEKPARKVGPQPVQPVRKEQQKDLQAAAKPGKRKGPLPAALVQLLLLASFAGLGYLVFFKEREVDRVLAVGLGAVLGAYKKVAGVFAKGAKSS